MDVNREADIKRGWWKEQSSWADGRWWIPGERWTESQSCLTRRNGGKGTQTETNQKQDAHCRSSSPVVSSFSGKEKERPHAMNGEQKRCGKGIFFNQGFIYIQMCTNPQNSVCSCSKSEIQNFCPLQHPEEWKYKMLTEAHSNQVKMRDRAASRKQDWRAAWRTPGEAGACELLVTPVSKLPGKAWTIS